MITFTDINHGIISASNINITPAMLLTSGSVTETYKEASMFGILSRKKCKLCGKKKKLTEFYKDKKAPDELFYTCKQCELNRSHEWWESHKDDNDRPRRLEVKKKYYRNNKARLDEVNKQWAKDNPEKRRAILQRSYLKSPEKFGERSDKWRSENPDKARSIWFTRRARESGADGKITAKEWRELKKKYNYACLCCSRREPEIKLTLDHVVPLVKGGKNIISNGQPLCQSCNSKKGTRIIDYR